MPSTRRLLPLTLVVIGLAALVFALLSRSSGPPEPCTTTSEASPGAPTGLSGLRSGRSQSPAAAISDAAGSERPAPLLAARITGSLERMSSRDADWSCEYRVTSAGGAVLRSGRLRVGSFEVDWPWEPLASIEFSAPGCRTFKAELSRMATDLGSVRLVSSLLYRGRLQSTAGVPATGVLVELVGRARSRVGRAATTDEVGGFAIETDLREVPLPSQDGATCPDLWLLATRRDRGDTCVVSASPLGFLDSHVVVVEFRDGVVILVRRPSGTPVPDAVVQLDPDLEGGTPFQAAPAAYNGTTDATGRCTVGWPPALRQAMVRIRVPGEPPAVGYLRQTDTVGGESVVLTLPVSGNRIQLTLSRAWTASSIDHDVLGLQAGWTVSGGESAAPALDSIRLEAPVPPGGEPWSVRLIDSPSLRFDQFLTKARWRVRYLGGGGRPAVSDGTVELRRAHSNLEGEIALPPESSSAEPEDVLWISIREDADGAVGSVESLSLFMGRAGGGARSSFGRVAWSTPSVEGERNRLIAIEGIRRPSTTDVDATSEGPVSLVLRSSGGRQHLSTCSVAQWARAYDAGTPLRLDFAPSGLTVHVLSQSSDGVRLPNVQLLTMCLGGAVGSEHWTQEEYVTDSSGGADIVVPRADADLLVLAKTRDGRMGRTLVKAGDSRADVVLSPGDVLVTSIRLFDGRTPVQATAYLVTRPISGWTIPCAWDATHAQFSSVRPVALEFFDVRIEASAIEETGSSPLDRKEHRYRLAVLAKDAQGKTIELPRLTPQAFNVK